MIRLKDILLEVFDTATDLLLNPQYDNVSFNDLLNDFREYGGKVLGQGSYGIVLSHPKWKYVLKIFSTDTSYLKFVRFALQNPRPSFPVFYDKPRKIIPHYRRPASEQFIYVIRMEKLEPITRKQYMDIDFYLHYGLLDFSQHPQNDVWKRTKLKVNQLNRQYPKLKQFAEDYNFLIHSLRAGSLDMSENNVMKRPDGSFVLSDPFWGGESPYQRHDRLQKIEMDYYGYDDEKDEPMVGGGERYKYQKPKSMVPTEKETGNDVPFEEGVGEYKYFIDLYNKDGEVFSIADVRTDFQLPKSIHKIFQYYDPGTIPHIVIKDSEHVPIKTITYDEWVKAYPVSPPKRVDLAV